MALARSKTLVFVSFCARALALACAPGCVTVSSIIRASQTRVRKNGEGVVLDARWEGALYVQLGKETRWTLLRARAEKSDFAPSKVDAWQSLGSSRPEPSDGVSERPR